MKLTLLAGCLGLLASLASFSGKENTEAFKMNTKKNPSPSLDSTNWELTGINHDSGLMPVTGKRAFIRFDAKGSVSGNGSCNRFGGSFSTSADSLHFSSIFSTKMYCQDVQAIENAFLGSLEKANRYEIVNRRLLLYQGEELLLVFSTAPKNAD